MNSDVPCTVDLSRRGVNYVTEWNNGIGNGDVKSRNQNRRLEKESKAERKRGLEWNAEFLESECVDEDDDTSEVRNGGRKKSVGRPRGSKNFK